MGKKTSKTNGLGGIDPRQRWAIDYDYIDQLNPKAREWLEKFTGGYYYALRGERRSARYKQSVDALNRWDRISGAQTVASLPTSRYNKKRPKR